MYSSSAPKRLASQSRSRSSGLRSPSALACCASRAETGKISGLKPSRRSMFSLDEARSPRRPPASSRSRSILLMMTTIFLPHSRIASMNSRSLSVNGRSAEVTKRTRSERGTNCWVRCSCSRMIALVPGVSTTVISSRKSAGKVAHDDAVRVHGHRRLGVAVAEQVDDRGGRGDAFRHDLGADQGVDEGGLAGVELADDDQQEERGQVLGRVGRRRPGPRRWRDTRQDRASRSRRASSSVRSSCCCSVRMAPLSPVSRLRLRPGGRCLGPSPASPLARCSRPKTAASRYLRQA